MHKPETGLINRVNRYLPKRVYHEKMNNPYRGGTPDLYYEGPNACLWVEFKWYDPVPPRIELIDNKLSRLQQAWLQRCHDNGRPCAVVVGAPAGCVIYPGTSWQDTLDRDTFLQRCVSPQDVANWINNQV